MEVRKIVFEDKILRNLFSNFSPHDLNGLKIARFPPDVTIIKRNTFSDFAYLIVSGICGIFNSMENGEEFCYYKISNYDVIGISEMLNNHAPREADIRTLTDVLAIKILKSDFRTWMSKHPQLYNYFINTVIDRLHWTLKKYIECKKYSSNVNLISYLIYSYDLYKKTYPEDFEGDIKINETREMISDFISASVRSVNYNIEILKNRNFIDIHRGKIYINHEQYERLKDHKIELLL